MFLWVVCFQMEGFGFFMQSTKFRSGTIHSTLFLNAFCSASLAFLEIKLFSRSTIYRGFEKVGGDGLRCIEFFFAKTYATWSCGWVGGDRCQNPHYKPRDLTKFFYLSFNSTFMRWLGEFGNIRKDSSTWKMQNICLIRLLAYPLPF